jgi:hypothetical protein
LIAISASARFHHPHFVREYTADPADPAAARRHPVTPRVRSSEKTGRACPEFRRAPIIHMD